MDKISQLSKFKEEIRKIIHSKTNIGKKEKDFKKILMNQLGLKDISFLVPDLVLMDKDGDKCYFVELKIEDNLNNLLFGFQAEKNHLSKLLAEVIYTKEENHKLDVNIYEKLKNNDCINKNRSKGKEYISQSYIYDIFKYYRDDCLYDRIRGNKSFHLLLVGVLLSNNKGLKNNCKKYLEEEFKEDLEKFLKELHDKLKMHNNDVENSESELQSLKRNFKNIEPMDIMVDLIFSENQESIGYAIITKISFNASETDV